MNFDKFLIEFWLNVDFGQTRLKIGCFRII